MMYSNLLVSTFFLCSICLVLSAHKPSIHHIHAINRSASTLSRSSGALSKYSKTSLHNYRAGSVMATSSAAESSTGKFSIRSNLLRNMMGLWGVLQVVSIVANALKRLIPIALQPIMQQDMQPFHWVLYTVWSMYMMYAEGYKAFQLKFSPLVVHRAFALVDRPTILNCVFAGPYAMGLFGATRKRMIIGWSITAGVFSLVKVVKMLPYPYRSIVDAGVVAGLSYGTMSIVVLTLKRLLGGRVEAGEDARDPAFDSAAVDGGDTKSKAN